MESGGGKITLDQESFRALASDVRVEVLKRLDVRRETVTDLSNLLSLSKPTLLEHLEKLQAAGLVKRIDEGRKWIYYELSDKGRKVLHPERVAITLALSSAAALAAVGIGYLAFSTGGPLGSAPRQVDLGSEAPAMAASAEPSIALIALALSGIAFVIALLVRRWGRGRRNRFFAELAS